MKAEITCPHCHKHFVIADSSVAKEDINYCPFCRHSLHPEKMTTLHMEHTKEAFSTHSSAVSFLQEHVPETEQILFAIGPYQVLQRIGKGGMGEVFLAYDTTCGRRLALKQIRADLIEHKHLHNRFLKEARITSQLTHPAIIPIYSIHTDTDLTYYTMPYIEGKTLKLLLREARQQEQNGEKMDHVAESIPALTRIFLSICQAVAYAHSKDVLHRDLKPENIIVGQYGQIVILDWGLAKMLRPLTTHPVQTDFTDEESLEEDPSLNHLTHIGRVVGTVSYMAPERALGMPANCQTDIYSLGIILYQMLTLRHPFHRPSLKAFRKNVHKERLVDPIEVAPYRDIPRSLSLVVMKCLAPDADHRYQSVDQLIHELENYIEGRSEWFQIAQLDIHKKSDWEFQENVFIAEHVALIREADPANWVNLMISKDSFQETIKIDVKIKIGEKCHGVGLLLNIPEAAERHHINDGYCLWLGTESTRSTKLLRSMVEVISSPDCFLTCSKWHLVRIEKVENKIHVYLDNVLQFSYISHIPLAGTHVGLLVRDADYSIKDFCVSVGSHNVTVNCLAVPDAFLAHNDYATALTEYRRIGYSFPGRAEGREAMFRAGITLLEQANNTLDTGQKEHIYDLAREEFHKLHNTPGAPLEYLGKALVYQSIGDFEEEAKCFGLAYRRYPKHPL
ncbi:MAG: protein kinase, partial [Parachlamydiaceae bacterium]